MTATPAEPGCAVMAVDGSLLVSTQQERPVGRLASAPTVLLLVAVSLGSSAATLLAPHLLTGPPAMNGSARGTALVIVWGGVPVLAIAYVRARVAGRAGGGGRGDDVPRLQRGAVVFRDAVQPRVPSVCGDARTRHLDLGRHDHRAVEPPGSPLRTDPSVARGLHPGCGRAERRDIGREPGSSASLRPPPLDALGHRTHH